MKVRVFHNTDAKFGLRGYQHGDRLTVVVVYDDEGANDAMAALNRAWTLFNVGDDPAFGEPSPVALDYRRRRNRSLCIGDVVEVDARAFAITSLGFAPLMRITNLTVPGTTAVADDANELASLLDWHQDEPNTWTSSQAGCPPSHNPGPGVYDDYLLAVVTTTDGHVTWRVDYHESSVGMPAEGIRTGDATTVAEAQAAAERTIRELLEDPSAV